MAAEASLWDHELKLASNNFGVGIKKKKKIYKTKLKHFRNIIQRHMY